MKCLFRIYNVLSGVPLSPSLSAGVGVFHRINTMANNTGLEADSDHQLGDITCHSSSRQPHVGRWITPNGDDITLTGNDIFSVEFRSGHFPSYIVLSLKQGIYVATHT